jgi:hypothetical protein
MNQKEKIISQKLNSAIDKIKPNVLDNVLAHQISTAEISKAPRRTTRLLPYSLGFSAAACVMAFFLLFSSSIFIRNNPTDLPNNNAVNDKSKRQLDFKNITAAGGSESEAILALEKYRPEGYNSLIGIGLTREMEKSKDKPDTLFNVVIGFSRLINEFNINYKVQEKDFLRGRAEELYKLNDGYISGEVAEEEINPIKKADDKNDVLIRQYQIEKAQWVSNKFKAMNLNISDFLKVYDNLYYYQFTYDEIMELADKGVECYAIGSEILRPEGYSNNITDKDAWIIHHMQLDEKTEVHYSIEFSEDYILPSDDPRARSVELSKNIFTSIGLSEKDSVSDPSVFNIQYSDNGKEFYRVYCTFLLNREQAQKLAEINTDGKISISYYSNHYSEAVADYFYLTNGDGFSASNGTGETSVTPVYYNE